MDEEELEIYNPAASDQHKLGTIFSKNELKVVALVNLVFIVFTLILYYQYVKNPGCPSEPPCWDLRPMVIFLGAMGTLATLIPILFSLFRHSRKKE